MLAEIAAWWLAQMRELLPEGLLSFGTAPDARIIAINRLEARPAGTVLLRRNGLETAIGALDFDHAAPPQPGLATFLRLPPEHVLSREVLLPLAAAGNPEAAMRFEMDRLTPFDADELFWGIGGVQPDRQHGRLSVTLCFVLRAELDPPLQALRRIGLTPAFIEAGDGRIALNPAHHAAPGWARHSAALLCAVLALACVVSPFLRQQLALDAADRQIAVLAPAAQHAEALRRQLRIAASAQAAIAMARRSGDALLVLAALTDALPDGSWLDDLLLKPGDLTFDGQSADAAALIGRLSGVPGLKDPSFIAPVTRTADGSADQFSMHVTVRE